MIVFQSRIRPTLKTTTSHKGILQDLGHVLVTMVVRLLATLENTILSGFDVLVENDVETTIHLCNLD
jgi:hypothetical protein